MEMKLKITLVPETSWFTNLRNSMEREAWTSLSREVRGKHNRICQYCGWAEDPEKNRQGQYTHLHEVWEYDDENCVQKLVGFECICPDCHMVHHWGFAQISGLDMDKLTEHACRINGCSKEDWAAHVKESFDTWGARSELNWKTDLGGWKNLVKEV